MSQSQPPSAAESPWAKELARRLQAQRDRMYAAAEAQRQRAREWESSLQSQLAAISQALQAAADGVGHRDADIAGRAAELEAIRKGLESAHQDHLARQQALLDEVARQLGQVRQQEAELTSKHAAAAATQAEAETLRKELQAVQRQLAQREETLLQREQSAVRREEEIKQAQVRTRTQRTAIAHELRARRKELLADAERQRTEAAHAAAGDESALSLQLAEAKLEISKLRAAQDGQVHEQLALEERYAQARHELSDVQERLKVAESRPAGEGEESADTEELRSRLEMALADLRELKQKNAELMEQAARGPSGGGALPMAGGAMDWESRKQLLLAQLESDFDGGDPQQKANKLTVENAIQQTEEVIAAKNEEIAELQRLLSEQSGNIGGVAIGAAAIAEILNTDDLVRQERESLREMQEKLREQLKQAEIDISMERAKIARERALMDEQMRQLEELKSQQQSAQPDDPADKGKKGSNRGRWLQRLGLRDEEKKDK